MPYRFGKQRYPGANPVGIPYGYPGTAGLFAAWDFTEQGFYARNLIQDTGPPAAFAGNLQSTPSGLLLGGGGVTSGFNVGNDPRLSFNGNVPFTCAVMFTAMEDQNFPILYKADENTVMNGWWMNFLQGGGMRFSIEHSSLNEHVVIFPNGFTFLRPHTYIFTTPVGSVFTTTRNFFNGSLIPIDVPSSNSGVGTRGNDIAQVLKFGLGGGGSHSGTGPLLLHKVMFFNREIADEEAMQIDTLMRMGPQSNLLRWIISGGGPGGGSFSPFLVQ